MIPESGAETLRGRSWRRCGLLLRAWPMLLLALATIALYASGLDRSMSLHALETRQAALRAFVAARPAEAALLYVAIYTAYLGLSLPAAGILTIAGGMMFGTAAGTALATFGTGLASLGLFLVFRASVGDRLRPLRRPFIERIRRRMEVDGVGYLFMLRLLPVLPFWVASLLPALVGMSLRTYMLATVIGVIPPTFLFVSLGTGLQRALSEHAAFHLIGALSTGIVLPLLGLAALSALAMAWRRRRGG